MGNVTLNGATSGQITLSPTAVAGTNTVTVAAQTGTLNVAAPAFSGYASASQTVTLNTTTKVAINTKDFDTNTNYDATTNYRFTPTVAGYYQINVALRGQVVTTFTQCVASIYKNGSEYKRFAANAPFSANSAFTQTGNAVVYCNGSTDYIEFYGTVNGTGTATFDASSSSVSSQFSAALVRGA